MCPVAATRRVSSSWPPLRCSSTLVGMVEPKVKGVSFRTVHTVFGELRGKETLERALGLMKPEVSEAYRKNMLLAASWYPISWYRDALSACRRAAHEGPELMRAIGYRSMMLDMGSTYKQIVAR